MIPSLRSATLTRKASALALSALAILLMSTALTAPVQAFRQNDSPVVAKEFRHPNLHIPSLEQPLSELPGLDGRASDLLSLGVTPDGGRYDWRAGRWTSLVLSQPLVPGDGLGNTLGSAATVNEAQVWQALTGFIRSRQQVLDIDLAEAPTPNITIFEGGNLIQVFAHRVVDGIPVRGSAMSAHISHGNLVLLAFQNWGSIDASAAATLTAARAEELVAAYLKPFTVARVLEAAHLEVIPLARGQNVQTVQRGLGYDNRLAWVLTVAVKDDSGRWEAVVDANSGELIAFEDKVAYATRRIIGGVYPVSNDQRPPDGLEQPLWPMPFANVTTGPAGTFTSAGGVVQACVAGNLATTLFGQYIRIADVCGAVNETTALNDLDLAVSPGTDCVVPPGHSTGDTHSARTGFYELNRIKEQGRSFHLTGPPAAWLNGVLTANMNQNTTCNASWGGGTVNFRRDNGSACRNTGEIAAIFDHEWGHGMDDNDNNGSISQPQEGIADGFATLRLDNSCVGRGFFKNQVCGGYGDPCIGTPLTGCTGVRDADFAQHVSGQPHGIPWVQTCPGGGSGPCGRAVHCEGQVASETIWDLHARDLKAPPYNFDNNTALELATRLYYLSTNNVQAWYTCSIGGGCSAAGAYMAFLAADDDNGNLNDGTPHMTAIRGAFERHDIHCATPAVVDSGCAGGPTTAPTVVATPTAGGVNLSWAAVPGASNYQVYRTEGVNGCDFGKIKAGQTNATTWSDTSGLLDGRAYLYSVFPVGANSSCFGRMSACATATPTPAADPCAVTNASVSFVLPKTTVAEAGVNATIQVTVITNNNQVTVAPLTVNFATVDGTATAPADYTATSGTLTFPAGTTSGATQNIIVPVIQESLDEFDEDFMVVLSNVAGGVISPNVTNVVTIVDDDVPVELQSFEID